MRSVPTVDRNTALLEKTHLIIHCAMQYANHDDPVAPNLVKDQIIAVHTAANTRFVMARDEGKHLRHGAEKLAAFPEFGNETNRAARQIASD